MRIWLQFAIVTYSPILIFFCCVFDNTYNCFCFFIEQNVCIYVTFRIHHGLFYAKKCCMSQHNKQARQTFHWFVLNSHFIQQSECKYVLFVCLSDYKCCVSDTLAGDFFFRTVDISRESRVVSPTL